MTLSKVYQADATFAGFTSPTYTMVPDQLFDELLPDLTGGELKVLLYIIRRTFGFKKAADDISLHQMVKGIIKKDGTRLDRGAGVSMGTAQAAIKGLTDKHIIQATRNASAEKGDEPTTYTLRFRDPVNRNWQRGGAEIDNAPPPFSGNGGYQKLATQETVVQETENKRGATAPRSRSGARRGGTVDYTAGAYGVCPACELTPCECAPSPR